MAAQNVHPRVARRLDRNGTIDLTMQTYTHRCAGDDARAVEALPPPQAKAAMAGIL